MKQVRADLVHVVGITGFLVDFLVIANERSRRNQFCLAALKKFHDDRMRLLVEIDICGELDLEY